MSRRRKHIPDGERPIIGHVYIMPSGAEIGAQYIGRDFLGVEVLAGEREVTLRYGDSEETDSQAIEFPRLFFTARPWDGKPENITIYMPEQADGPLEGFTAWNPCNGSHGKVCWGAKKPASMADAVARYFSAGFNEDLVPDELHKNHDPTHACEGGCDTEHKCEHSCDCGNCTCSCSCCEGECDCSSCACCAKNCDCTCKCNALLDAIRDHEGLPISHVEKDGLAKAMADARVGRDHAAAWISISEDASFGWAKRVGPNKYVDLLTGRAIDTTTASEHTNSTEEKRRERKRRRAYTDPLCDEVRASRRKRWSQEYDHYYSVAEIQRIFRNASGYQDWDKRRRERERLAGNPFKVGTVVRIKSGEKSDIYNIGWVSDYMVPYIGTLARISYITYATDVSLQTLEGANIMYNWSTEWLEPVTDAIPADEVVTS